MTLKQAGTGVTGILADLEADLPVTGTIEGGKLALTAKPTDPDEQLELTGTLGARGLAGEAIHRGKLAQRNITTTWTATRMPANRPAAPRTLGFMSLPSALGLLDPSAER